MIGKTGISEWLTAMEEAGITTPIIHEKTKIARGTLDNWRKGKTSPHWPKLLTLRKHYALDLNMWADKEIARKDGG